MNRTVHVIGAGPAGAAAALSARRGDAAVVLHEQSRFPRHKVCGEFLSPEVQPILERIGAWEAFAARRPARITRMGLWMGRQERCEPLPEAAFGLSRYALDELMLGAACEAGVEFRRERCVTEGVRPLVLATGRRPLAAQEKGQRLFGFKAHFTGPANDAVELYFFDGCYVGVNAVEGGVTNVCGLGPEHVLRRYGFAPDELLATYAPLRERLRPMVRAMDWHSVGPLVFGNRLRAATEPGVYPAGDLLSFVDPFTGSGMLCALLSGSLAGRAAAEGQRPQEYLEAVDAAIGRPFLFSSLLRSVVQRGWAEWLLPFVPGDWLFKVTRPRRVA